MPNQTYAITGSAGGPISRTFTSAAPTVYHPGADLPETVFHTRNDALTEITMTLKPEYSITAPEALKIMMMLTAAIHSPMFSVYQYVKKNDLERHFKYSQ